MNRFAILRLPGWVGIYVDGVLVYENELVEPDDLLDLLGIKYDYQYIEDATAFGNGAPLLWDDLFEKEEEIEEKYVDDEA